MEESITEPIDMSQPASGAGADTAAVRSEDGQATEDAPAQVSETSSPSAVNRAEEQVRVRRNVVAGISAPFSSSFADHWRHLV